MGLTRCSKDVRARSKLGVHRSERTNSKRQTSLRLFGSFWRVVRKGRVADQERNSPTLLLGRTEKMMATQVVPCKRISDTRLMRAGQHGEPQALNTLFQQHHKSLFHSALGVLRNPEDAEDALQDGLLSAFRNLKNFEGRSQFSTWLTRVVINAALMRRRSLAARPTTTVEEPLSRDELPITERLVSKGPTPEQLFARLEIREIINDHIDELSPILRTVFVLRIVQGYKTAETAKILSLRVNTVKARLRCARHQLAGRLSRSLLKEVNAPSD
jgi:RNA polymerase sigma-70 factor (ECF subfamily)